jgi:CheY-like chemotaxis protein
LRILAADDILENRQLLLALCEQRGHSVTFANNGLEAVGAFRQGKFDVVLMDIQMPEMNGIEATASIRRLEAEAGTDHTPIVALTAHAMKGDREKYLGLGMDAYISKPIDRDLLFQAIEEVTAQVTLAG